MRPFRFIDHTGDEGAIVYGATVSELFQNAAESFWSVLTDPTSVRAVESHRIVVVGEGYEELLVSWLNELLYLFETTLLIGCRHDVEELNPHHLQAVVWGETYQEERHPLGRIIKAVTHHQLYVQEREGIWEAQIIFDL